EKLLAGLAFADDGFAGGVVALRHLFRNVGELPRGQGLEQVDRAEKLATSSSEDDTKTPNAECRLAAQLAIGAKARRTPTLNSPPRNRPWNMHHPAGAFRSYTFLDE